MPSETDEERARREARRVLFDTVADLYDATRPGYPGETVTSGLFGEVVVREHRAARRLPSETVLGLEHTRATSLGYDPATRAVFTAEVRALLPPGTEVPLEQETWLAMAPLRACADA